MGKNFENKSVADSATLEIASEAVEGPLAHTYIDRVKLKNMALSMKIKYKIKMHFRKKLALHQKQKLDKKQNNI